MSWLSEGVKAVGKGINSVFTGIMGDPYQANPYNINQDAFLKRDNSRLRQLDSQMLRAVNRETPLDNSQRDYRSGQSALIGQLSRRAYGAGGPSLAQNALKQGTQRNLASQMAFAASQGTANPAAVIRGAQNNMAAINRQAGMDAANIGLQEQQQAQSNLASVLANARNQDIEFARAQQAGQLNQMSLNDAMQRYLMESQLGIDRNRQLDAMDLERLRTQQQLGIDQVNAGSQAASQQAMGNFIGGLGTGAAALAQAGVFSDKRLKTDIKSDKQSSKELTRLLNSISAKKYRYKDEVNGKGEFISPMAQDLEKTKLGKGMVINTPNGKMVDYGRAGGVMLAAAADLNKKIGKLESAQSKLAKTLAKRRAA